MNRDEFLALMDDGPGIIRGRIFADQTDRTLLLGTNEKRMNWHVYLMDCKIHCVVYDFNGTYINYFNEDITDYARDFIPPRKIHPETCDLMFMRILKRLGLILVFTEFNDGRPKVPFYGLTLNDVTIDSPTES